MGILLISLLICSFGDIILLLLCPNSTHILQVLGVEIFSPPKVKYSELCEDWKIIEPTENLTELECIKVVKATNDAVLKPTTITNGRSTNQQKETLQETTAADSITATPIVEANQQNESLQNITAADSVTPLPTRKRDIDQKSSPHYSPIGIADKGSWSFEIVKYLDYGTTTEYDNTTNTTNSRRYFKGSNNGSECQTRSKQKLPYGVMSDVSDKAQERELEADKLAEIERAKEIGEL